MFEKNQLCLCVAIPGCYGCTCLARPSMLKLLCLLSVALTTVNSYISLTQMSYVRLQNGNGGFTINSSTYNRIAFDADEGILYAVAKEPNRLTIFTLNLDGTLTQQSVHVFQEQTKGEPYDIEICKPSMPGGTKRLAISFEDPNSPSADGSVRFYHPLTAGNYLIADAFRTVTVGAQPMDLEFAQDCLVLLVANRGRPSLVGPDLRDPEGTVTKISTPFDFNPDSQITITNIGFGLVNDGAILADLMAQNFRPWPLRTSSGPIPDISVSKNIEPVNVITAPNGQNAYVAMPKNNAIARINLDTNLVSTIWGMGNRSWDNFYLDASRSDGDARMSRFPVYSTLGARQIKWVVQEEAQWMITLDSGFIDNIPEYGYTGSRTGAQLAAGTGNSPPISVSTALRAQLQNNQLLGEAEFSIEDGKAADGLTLERLFLNGGRGISIRAGGTLDVATSLVDNIERVSSQAFTTIFNSGYRVPTNTPQQDREASSPTFGPDLSVIETGIFNGQKVLFLGSAQSGIIYVYVLVPSAECPQPYWHSAVRSGNTFATWNTAYANSQMGDIGITDMLYIPRQGQRTVDVLIVASSTSNSISSYRVSDI